MKILSNHRGLSLVEVLVASVILAGSSAFVMTVFANAQKISADAPQLQASQIIRSNAETLLSEIQATDWSTGSNDLYPGSYSGAAQTLNGITYTPTWTTTEVGGSDGFRKAKVKVTWS